MIEIKLVGITEIEEKHYLEYMEAWKRSNETLSPSISELNEMSFTAWKKYLISLQDNETKPQDMVKAETLFLVEENGYIIGMTNLRYDLTPDLLKYGGHLSFGIRPEERGKGYGFIIVKLSLNVIMTHGIPRALITSKRENKAARNTIRKIGGKLENSYEQDGSVIDRYWIEL